MQSPVIHIRTPKKSGEDGGTLTSTHLLPCKVKCVCDGEEEVTCSHPAKVDEFFDPVIRTVGSEGEETRTRALGEEYSATFRGRPLRGVLVKIPDGFTGQVLHEHGAASFTEENKEFDVKSQFNEFYYWNLQSSPTPDDKLLQALQFTRIAEKLHRAVTPENIQERES